jgi:WD40 repeat protein
MCFLIKMFTIFHFLIFFLVYAGLANGSIDVWNTGTHTLVTKLNGHLSPITGIILTLNDTLLISGSYDGSVRFWNTTNNWSLITTFFTASKSSYSSYNNVYLVALELLSSITLNLACGLTNQIQIWNIPTNTLVQTLISNQQQNGITGVSTTTSSLAYLKALTNGQQLASSYSDGLMLIWNVTSATSVYIQQQQPKQQDNTASVNVYPLVLDQLSDGSLVNSNGQDVQVWNVSSVTLLNSYSGFAQVIKSLKALPNGNLAVAGDNGFLEIWQISRFNASRLKNLSLSLGVNGDSSTINALAIYDNQTFIAGYGSGNMALVSDLLLTQSMGLNDNNKINVLTVSSESECLRYFLKDFIRGRF